MVAQRLGHAQHLLRKLPSGLQHNGARTLGSHALPALSLEGAQPLHLRTRGMLSSC